MARKKLKRNPDNREAAALARGCERFFRSDWFRVLVDLDGYDLLDKLRRETA